MAFAPGDVVFLKSGGSPMTVTAVGDDGVDGVAFGVGGGVGQQPQVHAVPLMSRPTHDPATGTRWSTAVFWRAASATRLS